MTNATEIKSDDELIEDVISTLKQLVARLEQRAEQLDALEASAQEEYEDELPEGVDAEDAPAALEFNRRSARLRDLSCEIDSSY